MLLLHFIHLDFIATNKFVNYKFGIDIRQMNLVACRLVFLLAYGLPSASAHIISVISIDRYISIVKPDFFQLRKKFLFQASVCLGCLIFNIAFYSPLLFSFWVFYETADPSSLTLEINTNGSSNIFIRKCALVEWVSLYWRGIQFI